MVSSLVDSLWSAAYGTEKEDQAGCCADASNCPAKSPGRPPRVTQNDLESAVADCGTMRDWAPEKWNHVKTLAHAASGVGTVELMISKEQSGQRVAVKKLPWRLMRSSPQDFEEHHPTANERPWTDVAIVKHLNKLRFPCACELLGIFLWDEQVCIMSSFATRGDLFGWCQSDTTRPGEEREGAMRPIVSQMFAAVCWLHDVGIAHRDLSCENVMLTELGENVLQVKIIDFGMASLSRMALKQVRGKRSYQAPEMHDAAEYDIFLADDFSLGVILYCMAVHYYPWEHTKPGKDRSCEFARAHGVETFLGKKRMPCNKKPVADCCSRSLLDLLCGLLDFAPEKRWSIGEGCFGTSSSQPVNSQSSAWLGQV